MKFGIWLPYSDTQWVTNMARLAERMAWNGVFLHESVVGMDRWILVAAAALSTRKISIGGVISPSTRADPRHIYKEAYRINRRSGHRLIVCLGLGFDGGPCTLPEMLADQVQTGRDEDPGEGRRSAAWFTDRLEIWQMAVWPDRNSMARALGYQGVVPVVRDGKSSLRSPTREEIRDLVDFIKQEHSVSDGFEIVVESMIDEKIPHRLASQAASWESAGASWWIINCGKAAGGAQDIHRLQKIIDQGPPN